MSKRYRIVEESNEGRWKFIIEHTLDGDSWSQYGYGDGLRHVKPEFDTLAEAKDFADVHFGPRRRRIVYEELF